MSLIETTINLPVLLLVAMITSCQSSNDECSFLDRYPAKSTAGIYNGQYKVTITINSCGAINETGDSACGKPGNDVVGNICSIYLECASCHILCTTGSTEHGTLILNNTGGILEITYLGQKDNEPIINNCWIEPYPDINLLGGIAEDGSFEGGITAPMHNGFVNTDINYRIRGQVSSSGDIIGELHISGSATYSEFAASCSFSCEVFSTFSGSRTK